LRQNQEPGALLAGRNWLLRIFGHGLPRSAPVRNSADHFMIVRRNLGALSSVDANTDM